jgi:anti-sigma factor (TIGR02949 family)
MWYGSVALSETSCEEVLREIELYIDGELDVDRAADLADHLASCSPCMHHAAFQSRLREIVRRKCRSSMPDHVAVRIRVAIRSELLDES